MLGIGAGALGIAVAAKVAQAVADEPTPVEALTDEERQWVKDGKKLVEFEPPTPEVEHTITEIDWDKWQEELDKLELPPHDFIQESPPIVDEYQHRYNYVVNTEDIDWDSIKEFQTQPGNLLAVTADDRMDAFYQTLTTSGTDWGRNE